MTGPAREWRDKLARALREALVRVAGPDSHLPANAADAILPVVSGIVAGELRRAAADLRDHQAKAVVKASEHQPGSDRFVKEVGRASGYGAAAWRLCDRADEIDPT